MPCCDPETVAADGECCPGNGWSSLVGFSCEFVDCPGSTDVATANGGLIGLGETLPVAIGWIVISSWELGCTADSCGRCGWCAYVAVGTGNFECPPWTSEGSGSLATCYLSFDYYDHAGGESDPGDGSLASAIEKDVAKRVGPVGFEIHVALAEVSSLVGSVDCTYAVSY